ncbi:MAG: hypothetical protein ABIY55_12090 [Kofleriaceae bacterium]
MAMDPHRSSKHRHVLAMPRATASPSQRGLGSAQPGAVFNRARPSFRFGIVYMAAAIGCTVPDPGVTLQSDDTPPVAAVDFERALDVALCQLWIRCGVFEDQAACEATHTAQPSWHGAQRVHDIAEGKMVYDGSRGADCINRIASRSCSATRAVWPGAVRLLLAECDLFVLGSASEGDTCNHNEVCGPQGTCSPDRAGPSSGRCLAGTCVHIDNRVCGPGNPPCPGDETCLPGGVCGGDATVGDTCMADGDCVQGLICSGLYDLYGPTLQGKCAPAPTSGERCRAAECGIGLLCITTSITPLYEYINQCLPNVDRGQPCILPGEIAPVGACKQDSVCDVFTHTCVAPPARATAHDPDADVCR